MGDPEKFTSLTAFYLFHLSLLLMVLVEIFIFCFTYQKHENGQKVNHSDKGTKWLLIGNFYICIYLSFFSVSQITPSFIRNLRLPGIATAIGILFMLGGIVIRLAAVFTLKKAFTLSVQTTEKQHLITTGMYHLVRNPAYTGSVISLIGVAIGIRNIYGIFIITILTLICYICRIKVEEQTLTAHFGDEFLNYEEHTYRLFPYIW